MAIELLVALPIGAVYPGVTAIRRIRANQELGRPLATVGIVLGALRMVLGLIDLVAWVADDLLRSEANGRRPRLPPLRMVTAVARSRRAPLDPKPGAASGCHSGYSPQFH